MLVSITRKWKEMVGSEKDFPLEIRLFHGFSFLSSFVVLLNVPFKFFLGLHVTAILALMLFLLMLAGYRVSRFHNRTKFGRNLTVIAVYALLGINYYYNGGINGPSTLFLMFAFFAFVCITPLREFWIWAGLNVLVISFTILSQYYGFISIKQSYSNPILYYLDVYVCYIFILGLIAISTVYLIYSYNKEKKVARQQLAVLKIKDEERKKLMAIISHDFRAPLANIQGYLENVNVLDIPPKDKDFILAQLLNSTKTTMAMLDNMLQWSKSQMDGIVHEIKAVNIYEIALPLYELFVDIAMAKDIQLELVIDKKMKVLGNRGMLQVVLRNLINNAIKFTAAGGKIWIAAIDDNKLGTINIVDTGTGEPSNLPTNIFDNIHRSTVGTANENGYGLGLMICREFMQAQNGRISYHSRNEGGSVFSVSLPIAAH